jgi:large subunit ribosomal protein L33
MVRAADRDKTRIGITLSCTLCGTRNYKTTKARGTEGQLSLKKFCSACGTHTLHIASK